MNRTYVCAALVAIVFLTSTSLAAQGRFRFGRSRSSRSDSWSSRSSSSRYRIERIQRLFRSLGSSQQNRSRRRNSRPQTNQRRTAPSRSPLPTKLQTKKQSERMATLLASNWRQKEIERLNPQSESRLRLYDIGDGPLAIGKGFADGKGFPHSEIARNADELPLEVTFLDTPPEEFEWTAKRNKEKETFEQKKSGTQVWDFEFTKKGAGGKPIPAGTGTAVIKRTMKQGATIGGSGMMDAKFPTSGGVVRDAKIRVNFDRKSVELSSGGLDLGLPP